jgi:hypothetical protein
MCQPQVVLANLCKHFCCVAHDLHAVSCEPFSALHKSTPHTFTNTMTSSRRITNTPIPPAARRSSNDEHPTDTTHNQADVAFSGNINTNHPNQTDVAFSGDTNTTKPNQTDVAFSGDTNNNLNQTDVAFSGNTNNPNPNQTDVAFSGNTITNQTTFALSGDSITNEVDIKSDVTMFSNPVTINQGSVPHNPWTPDTTDNTGSLLNRSTYDETMAAFRRVNLAHLDSNDFNFGVVEDASDDAEEGATSFLQHNNPNQLPQDGTTTGRHNPQLHTHIRTPSAHFQNSQSSTARVTKLEELVNMENQKVNSKLANIEAELSRSCTGQSEIKDLLFQLISKSSSGSHEAETYEEKYGYIDAAVEQENQDDCPSLDEQWLQTTTSLRPSTSASKPKSVPNTDKDSSPTSDAGSIASGRHGSTDEIFEELTQGQIDSLHRNPGL